MISATEPNSYAQMMLDNPKLKTLWCMVGLPRSGKSTWAKLSGYPMVSPDSIRLAMHGQEFIGSMEPYVWAIAETSIKAAFISGHQNVVLDATSITVKRRDQWAAKQGKTPWDHVVFVHVYDSSERCKKRAIADGKPYLEGVIDRMSGQLETEIMTKGANAIKGYNYMAVDGFELITQLGLEKELGIDIWLEGLRWYINGTNPQDQTPAINTMPIIPYIGWL